MSTLPLTDDDLIKICNLEKRLRAPSNPESDPEASAEKENALPDWVPGKRRSTEPLRYYPIFKKVKTEGGCCERKPEVLEDRAQFSETSNEGLDLGGSIKNNRKITEFFRKQKASVMREKPSIRKVVASFTRNAGFNRKISFGDSNSLLGEAFADTGSQEKKKAKANSRPVVANGGSNPEGENFRLKDEIRKLNKKLVDKDALVKSEEARIRHLVAENNVLHEKIRSFETQITKNQSSQQLICKLLLETEKRKKAEIKGHILNQKQRLGEFVSQRQGHKFVEVWLDGFEIRQLKEKLNNVKNEREQIEKAKKNIKIKKNGTLNPFCIMGARNPEKTGDSLENNADSNSLGEPHVFDLKNRLSFKNSMLQKEEQTLMDELRRLENEKVQYIYEAKLFSEEEHCRFAKPDPETGLLAWPFINGKYQILSLLGKGGFSEVYRGYDVSAYSEVACKIHHLNSSWSEQAKHQYVKHALRENEIHKSLRHPNIVRLHEVFEIDSNTICTILEYCEGPDLSQYMKQAKCIPEKDAKCILKQIIAGIRYLHESPRKIIHYDLKPQNILFHRGEVKISDFGLCKIIEDNVTRCELTSQGVGTYWYLPPECFEMGSSPPNISTKVDIWSLGVIFYEMLFGEKPFGNNMSQERILKEQVILNSEEVRFPAKPSIPTECREFIAGCLTKIPEKRWDINGVLGSGYLTKK